jgi:hypothetical protein
MVAVERAVTALPSLPERPDTTLPLTPAELSNRSDGPHDAQELVSE